jgi:transcriptional regulator with XRE-family HTH domain
VVDKSLFKPRAILSKNLKGLMATKAGPNSQLGLARKSGVAQATIGRIIRQETAATIETLEDLAKAYGLQAWQLMVAGMDPNNPPVLQAVSKEERALYERLKSAVQDISKAQS